MINTQAQPISDISGVMAYTVHIPMVGTLVAYQDNYYELLSTVTYQEEKGVFVHKGTFLQVDDEGEDMGKEPITLDLGNPDIQVM